MSEEQLENGYYKIRPAARLIHTIGKDLIGDSYAALVELVKNSYDADAKSVEVLFEYKEIENTPVLAIIIKDDGHGMSFDTVVNKWLVPATNDKLKRKKSPAGRYFQGRKGIGRFAASILGQEMTMVSIDKDGNKSTAVIDWRIFNTDDFLENIELLVENEKTEEAPGTYLEIIARDEVRIEEFNGEKTEIVEPKLSYWTEGNIDNLENELRKLISPFKEFSSDNFSINLSFKDCPYDNYKNHTFDIEAFPIIELYDYRISGSINSNGKGVLRFENNIEETTQQESIDVSFKLENGGDYCGEIKIDFRVFDREPEAIQNLINKGLIDPISNQYVGKREARRLLNEVYGVNIYRSGFRIRPYGNGGIDWLDLDKDRIQDFTLRVSNNQVVGFITVEPEENSHLEEKSARDGLKENEAYFGLKELCKKALRELELRRLTYRKNSQKSRGGKKSIQKTLEDLFSFSDLEASVEGKLSSLNIGEDSIKEISTIIKKEAEKKTQLLEDVQKTIAIYQGQATLGKIVSFILHEGRKSIHYYRNEVPVLERYLRHYKANPDDDLFEEVLQSLDGFEKHSGMLSNLFKRINPLASQSRGKKGDFKVSSCIEDAVQIFKHSLQEKNISLEVKGEPDISLYGWQNDLYIALANLLENSIYWLDISEIDNKGITITAKEENNSVLIDYRDNGPGLSKDEIKSEIIFEPGYSKKLNGTGLGLAIAGEAVERLNGRLMAHESETGVYFRIELDKA